MALFQQPPPQPFVGGFQPLAPRELAPAIIAVPVNDPPFSSRDTALFPNLAAWNPPDPLPTQAKKLSPGIPGQSVNNPPIRLQTYAWYPITWNWVEQRKLSPGIPGQSVDNPIPRLQTYAWYPAVTGWTEQKKLSPGIPGQSVDKPPVVTNALELEIVRLWDPPLQTYAIVARRLSPGIPGQSVDQPPPFHNRLLSWPGPDPLPTLSRYLPQGFVTVAADTAPFSRAWFQAVLQYWQQTQPLPWIPRYYPQAGVIVVQEQPAFNQEWLWTVLNAYAPEFRQVVARKLSPGIPGQSVDNPIPRLQTYSWYPVTTGWVQQRKLSPGIPGQSVDNPPRFPATTIDEISVLWVPAAYATPRGANVASLILPSVVNNPPFGMPPDWLPSVLRSWQPPFIRYQPQLSLIVIPGIPPAVDNPPFGLRTPYGAIYTAWAPPPPNRIIRVQAIQEGPIPPIPPTPPGPPLYVGRVMWNGLRRAIMMLEKK